ncbi:hypothetical protein B0J13DRAFT_611783 [Dactylonectria estremocensis]|uniref:Uncharacterized protein n=1 Tax=Dactylonectria estremocensis TaxID=1079267 RepID=A0A9P9IPC0_9HYPO|nr:hypothetical protein B0J13DRAFT_611783 [Dactylonectria estremocensis]
MQHASQSAHRCCGWSWACVNRQDATAIAWSRTCIDGNGWARCNGWMRWWLVYGSYIMDPIETVAGTMGKCRCSPSAPKNAMLEPRLEQALRTPPNAVVSRQRKEKGRQGETWAGRDPGLIMIDYRIATDWQIIAPICDCAERLGGAETSRDAGSGPGAPTRLAASLHLPSHRNFFPWALATSRFSHRPLLVTHRPPETPIYTSGLRGQGDIPVDGSRGKVRCTRLGQINKKRKDKVTASQGGGRGMDGWDSKGQCLSGKRAPLLGSPPTPHDSPVSCWWEVGGIPWLPRKRAAAQRGLDPGAVPAARSPPLPVSQYPSGLLAYSQGSGPGPLPSKKKFIKKKKERKNLGKMSSPSSVTRQVDKT